MAFFLNNNTVSVFKAAKLLTTHSKDFVIFIKEIERAEKLAEMIDSYQKAAEVCAEMEDISVKSGLATGVGASEDRVDELIETMKTKLKAYITLSPDYHDAYRRVMEYESVLADEIIQYIQDISHSL
ncbi:MAG: hypothetical protein IJ443_09455 [Firmicutes bacterium]|nr:hypothetical protein [Bacillota bacterium]